MLTVISPAKSLDFTTPLPLKKSTQPRFLDHSEVLIEHLRKHSHQDIARLMKLSDKLAELNVHRYQSFTTPFTKENARPAIFSFTGDVYQGFDAFTLSAESLNYAQQHLRILSGLYGVLRPLDLIQAYRLEMGTKLATERGDNLYQFWDDIILQSITKELQKQASGVLVNLASNEYFKAVKAKQLTQRVIAPEFKDYKNGQYKIISFFAKRARGLMARYIVENAIDDPKDLTGFNLDGYRYDAKSSQPDAPIFLRKQA
ncbi:MAG: peroxide stress protein YaaA [Gammaproteobacteria bacterium]|nr:peroxide stress protein YaaA [Gammaproteobacteria bacterium]NVK88764.1 peroxide stress protein YaaA [Gammaproteobacteria bacterium]